ARVVSPRPRQCRAFRAPRRRAAPVCRDGREPARRQGPARLARVVGSPGLGGEGPVPAIAKGGGQAKMTIPTRRQRPRGLTAIAVLVCLIIVTMVAGSVLKV